MDAKTKEFNKYLAESKILDKLTGCFARLFIFTDFDRPDHGIWFLQNCMDSYMDPDFIVNYDKLLNELAANNRIIKNYEKAKEKAKAEEDRKAAKAKKAEELAKAKEQEAKTQKP
ncbi:hypothetical protein HA402_000693 [Bradysia odoriphaga]|nr:hypothetical protein HA402_000693 [Bradysia odoriphaga]